MISALFDLISAIASAFFQVLGALFHVAAELLSSAASVILWPVRAAVGLLFGRWGMASPWTNLYFLICGLLLLLLAVLVIWGLWQGYKQRKGHN